MTRRQPKQLGKLLQYVLGYRPDEFGLVPDREGFVPLKDLQQAIKEEEGWSYLRSADIQEVLITQPGSFELRDDRIRLDPRFVPGSLMDPAAIAPPEFLYHGARQKAYPHIMTVGLQPTRYPYVCLASQIDLALRIGRRRDSQPVLIKVHAVRAREEGILFHRIGELLYLVKSLPPNHLEGPPLPKDKSRPPPKSREKEAYRPAGSFEMDLRSIPGRLRQERERRSESWKREARRYRRMRGKHG